MINEFKGEYRFLSNFFMVPVHYEGDIYPSSEHAYMAAKTTDATERMRIARIPTCKEVKAAGRKIKLRDNWEQIKEQVMYDILTDKFTRHPALKDALINTGDQELIEGNWWGDKIWGVCLKTNQGKNLLGKTLMRIRSEIKPQVSITVVNKHHGHTGIYIGRGSPLGNPFPIDLKIGNTRTKVIEHYREWLQRQIDWDVPRVIDALNEIADAARQPGGVNIQCFCKPHACHGDVIKELIETTIRNLNQ